MGKTQKWVWVRIAGVAVLLIAVFGLSTIYAQGPSPRPTPAAAGAGETDASPVRLAVGRSTVVDIGSPIARVSLTSADIADAMVTSPNQLLINGKTPGTISMFVWDRGGSLRRYEVTVQRDTARLNEEVKQLFPNEKIEVKTTGKNVVLAGMVSSKDVIEKAVNVAASYVSSRDEVVSLLQLSPTAPSNQVLLRVRFAEVSRTALTELGINMAANGFKDGRWFGRSTTQQYPAPTWDEEGRFVFSDFLNLFLFDTENQLAATLKAMQNRGLFQSLAEPNLVAESGKEASFLAGGEIPVPVAQGGANFSISVMWKEFGVRLNFTPTVNGDRVHLKVKPEVSTLDFANAIVLDGFRIPALSTRRTETELELQNGQTFAIAGLMNNSVRNQMQKIPGIGDIPILGLFFKSKAAQKDQTELVVMITPVILPNNSNGVTPNLPRTPEQFMPTLPDRRLNDMPPPAFGASSRGASTVAPVAIPMASSPEPARGASPAQATATATPGAQVSAAKPAAQRAAPAPARPLTRDEQQRLEKARAEEIKQQTAKILADRRKAEEDKVKQDKLQREQAKRDAENDRKAQEAAKKKAEQDRDQQRSIDEAAARLKAAEALYQAELAKKNKQ